MIGVIEGKDNFLFLDNDTNRSVDQIEGRYFCDNRFLSSIKLCHDIRAFVLNDGYGGSYYHGIIPNKESVLRQYLGQGLTWASHGLPPVYKYKHLYPGSRSFFNPEFADSTQLPRYFSKTDTHWTHFGALEYLKLIFRTFIPQLEALLNKIEIKYSSTSQLGDLGRKLALPAETLELIQPLSPRAKLAFTNSIQNEGCVRHFINKDAPIKEMVVLNHDSTSFWLFSWFAELFSNVLCVHSADFDAPLMLKLKPKYNFFLQIERFFVRLPTNEFNLLTFIKDQEEKKQAATSAIPYIDNIAIMQSDPAILTENS